MTLEKQWKERTKRGLPKPLKDTQLDAIQKEFGVVLPPAYRDFLRTFGNVSDQEFEDLEINLKRVIKSNRMVRESFREDRGIEWPSSYFVIGANQGIDLAVLDTAAQDIYHIDPTGDDVNFKQLGGLDGWIASVLAVPALEHS